MSEESGLSFGEIFMAVRKKFKYVLLATVAFAALFCIAVEFLYNPLACSYEISFVLSYPASDTQKYPDGTPFYYRDIITLDEMQKAIGEDGRFDGIDVKKMTENDDITITPEIREVGNTLVETSRYMISVKSSYFGSRDLATAFLYAVARYPRRNVIRKAENINFMLDESTFTSADFEDRIDLLARQRESILAQYDEWIELYRESYSVSGITLVNYRSEAEIAFSSTLQNSLLNELETNGYVPLSELPSRLKVLNAEKAENELKIAALKAALSLGTPAFAPTAYSNKEIDESDSVHSSVIVEQQPLDLSEMLASLIARNVQIDSQLSVLTEANVTAFETRLKEVFDRMNGEEGIAASVRAVGKGLYEEETRVTFDTSQVIRRGGIGLALNIVCGIVFGFLVSCVGACIAVLPKRKRAAEPVPEEKPVAPVPEEKGDGQPAEAPAETKE